MQFAPIFMKFDTHNKWNMLIELHHFLRILKVFKIEEGLHHFLETLTVLILKNYSIIFLWLLKFFKIAILVNSRL